MSEIVKESPVVETKIVDNESGEEPEHDPHYDPIISLPEVEVPTLEEDETVMLSLRAKIYRYDSSETPPEWKERGTGNVKILRHKLNETVRVDEPMAGCPSDLNRSLLRTILEQNPCQSTRKVMRRDKTLKLCANHFITPFMTLKPSASCERAWVYSAKDFSDATVKTELLAIKFANIDNALKWKEVFEEAKRVVSENGNKKDVILEDKIISTDSLKLSDTFEEDKKNSSLDKEKENKLSSPKKQENAEITEKLSSMNIEETKES